MNKSACFSNHDENEIIVTVENDTTFPIAASDFIKNQLNNYTANPPEIVFENIFEQINTNEPLNNSIFSSFPLPESQASLHHFR